MIIKTHSIRKERQCHEEKEIARVLGLVVVENRIRTKEGKNESVTSGRRGLSRKGGEEG